MKLIFTRRLAELMDNEEFLREYLEESMAALGITMEIRMIKPLHKPTQVQLYQIIAGNWMAEKENSFMNGGILADYCGTAKV
jgi:SNF2 family DNA or RNA helicase